MSHIERDVCPTCNYWIGAIVEVHSKSKDLDVARSLGQSLRYHILDYFSDRAHQVEKELADVLESHLEGAKEAEEAREGQR